ncbi:MAG: GUN4 domain-containing protein [Cyanobacteria bacterium P01_F01_bin.150]
MATAIIMTALKAEYQAVQDFLSNRQKDRSLFYEKGIFTSNGQNLEVRIVQVGKGNFNTIIEALKTAPKFKPDIMAFVGVAGGIKDVAIGDVVAATKIYDYESGKVSERGFLSTPNLLQSSPGLISAARRVASGREWLKRIGKDTDSCSAFVAPIASGQKVVAAKESQIFELLRSHYNDATAIEMEGFGFLKALSDYNQRSDHNQIEAIVIRGISDLIDGKNSFLNGSEESRQARASHNASAFAFELFAEWMAQYISPDSDNTEQLPKSYEISHECSKKVCAINFSLNNLRRYLSQNDWIEANQETTNLFLKIVEKDGNGILTIDDIPRFPNIELQKINDLWAYHSEKKFSFIKQKEIWENMGGHLNDETEKYLGNCLGWREEHRWKDSSELVSSLRKAPDGHFPAFFLSEKCWRLNLFLLLFLNKIKNK